MASKILSHDMIQGALKSVEFFSKCPEFLPIKRTLDYNKSVEESNTGCTPCRRRRLISGITSDFVKTVLSLDDTGRQKLKSFFGCEKLIVNKFNASTGKTEIVEL